MVLSISAGLLENVYSYTATILYSRTVEYEPSKSNRRGEFIGRACRVWEKVRCLPSQGTGGDGSAVS